MPKFFDAQRPLLTGRNFWERGAHCQWEYVPTSTQQGLAKRRVQLKTVWKKPRLSVLHILKLTEGHTLQPSHERVSRALISESHGELAFNRAETQVLVSKLTESVKLNPGVLEVGAQEKVSLSHRIIISTKLQKPQLYRLITFSTLKRCPHSVMFDETFLT